MSMLFCNSAICIDNDSAKQGSNKAFQFLGFSSEETLQIPSQSRPKSSTLTKEVSVEGCWKVQEDTSVAIGRKFLLEIAESNQSPAPPEMHLKLKS
ncbi:hypothetical protein NC651_033700 [Populus alba x Populus x berolinensis]|nr:hypothetical protein NC651_033700 [Populus alba x Populus x berolinensis]